MTKVQSFDEYCQEVGVPTRPPSEAGLHTRGHMSDAAHRNALKQIGIELGRWQVLREQAQAAYDALVEAGEVRPPTSRERIEKHAMGHPDRSATKAARRWLERNGYPLPVHPSAPTEK